MLRIIIKNKLTLLLSLSALISPSLYAQAVQNPTPPPLAVKAYLLKNINSNMVVAQLKGSSRVEPASLTKIMTAYLVFDAIKSGHLQLTQTLPISDKAFKVEGSKMFVEPNKPVTVDELLHGLIIQSGNDAAIALAEGVAGDEDTFAQLMNKQAAKLGMKDTSFVNATGLPNAKHYTTAYDLSLLATALIQDFPKEYSRLYNIKEYRYNNITQPNRNRLLWADATVDGMKTGHTESAGFCLIASAKRNGDRLLSVVLGAPTDSARASESQKLLNFGFQFYDTTLVYQKLQPIKTIKVWKGQSNLLNATVANNVYLTLPKGEYANVKATMTSQQPLIAPVRAGQIVGKITFSLNNKAIDTRDLIAANDIAIAGFFGRLWDGLKIHFSS